MAKSGELFFGFRIETDLLDQEATASQVFLLWSMSLCARLKTRAVAILGLLLSRKDLAKETSGRLSRRCIRNSQSVNQSRRLGRLRINVGRSQKHGAHLLRVLNSVKVAPHPRLQAPWTPLRMTQYGLLAGLQKKIEKALVRMRASGKVAPDSVEGQKDAQSRALLCPLLVIPVS